MSTSEYQTHEDWQNIMQNRYGLPENQLQKCVDCRHLLSCHDFGETLDFWVCEMMTTPTGRNMPWDENNRACGLFEGQA